MVGYIVTTIICTLLIILSNAFWSLGILAQHSKAVGEQCSKGLKEAYEKKLDEKFDEMFGEKLQNKLDEYFEKNENVKR